MTRIWTMCVARSRPPPPMNSPYGLSAS
uniref:Uncharacterized protein n=1 Tax=Arundo donax TaxID=35708 RepID=A0A0A8YL56_ARUDO